MTPEEKIRAALMSLIKANVPVQTLPAIVSSVDAEAGTCNVEFVDTDLAPHYDVMLVGGANTQVGLLIIPEVSSHVLVSIVNNDTQWAFVAQYTEVAEIRLRGDSLGGLVKIEELISKLNQLEKNINDLRQAFVNWIPVANDGGAALKASASGWMAETIIETQQQELENTKVKHG